MDSKNNEEKLRKEQSSMMKENFDTMSRKNFKEAKEDYKKVDQGFKKNKSDDNQLGNTERKYQRDLFKKGGRINLRGGGCAKRGVKKNAYGKNS